LRVRQDTGSEVATILVTIFFSHFDHALVSLGTLFLGTIWPNIRGKGIEATS
jgi:hypothetical protein